MTKPERGEALCRTLICLTLFALAVLWVLAASTPHVDGELPRIEAPAAVQVAQAARPIAEALRSAPAWAGESGEYQVYQVSADVLPYALETADGLKIEMRADEHMVGRHGAETLAWLRSKPAGEVWYRARQGDEAFCLLVADPQSVMTLGVFLGARGLGTLPSAFDLSMVNHRLALTGWIMPLDRWHARLPRQDYARVW